MAIYSIYRLTNLVNGKVYIGQTHNFEKRLADHLRAARNGKGFVVHRAIAKYGIDQFTCEIILQSWKHSAILEFEKMFIEQHRSYDPEHGYNMTSGGEGLDSEGSRKLNLKRIADGTHNFVGEVGSQFATAEQLRRVENGTHPFSGELGAEIARTRNKQLAAEGRHPSQISSARGTHQFQGEKGSTLARERNARMLANGTHPSQVKVTCPHCSKTGSRSNMRRYHFDRCKQIPAGQ